MKTIIKNVSLDVGSIDKNIIQTLKKKIHNIFEGYCSEEHGYFLNIYDDSINIIDNFIKNDKVIFKVEMGIDSIKPEKNKNYEGVVKMISPDGIFIVVDDVLNILCCKESLSHLDYNHELNIYESPDGGININDIVQVHVLDMLYNNHRFSVFGNYVKKEYKEKKMYNKS